jgi:hypothetical protein
MHSKKAKKTSESAGNNLEDPDIEMQKEEHDATNSQAKNTQAKNSTHHNNQEKVKIPPIVVLSHDYKRIVNLMVYSDVLNYNVKFTTIGINIFCKSVEDFSSVKNLLNQKKIGYFTHPLPNEKEMKVVLLGLPDFDTDEIKNELLAVHDIVPKDIKKVHIKRTRFEKEVMFILYFHPNTISMKNLRDIRTIAKIMVKWDMYNSKFSRITQCRRCQMLGHGESFCNLPFKCLNCAEEHQTKDCPQGNDPPEDKIKCANCKQNHKADNPNCPSKIVYKNAKKKASTKNNNHNRNNYNTSHHLIQSMENFPHLTPRSRANYVENMQQPGRPNYADITRLSYVQNINNMPSTSHNLNINNKSSNFSFINNNTEGASNANKEENLFSPTELMTIMSDMIVRLKDCKTKEQQFQALADLTIKYLYASKP